MIKITMQEKLYKVFTYYLLISFGVIIVSALIYFRFLKERLPKNIPFLLTDYKFWILLYICCVYFYVVKSLIKPRKQHDSMKHLIENIYKPLILLDHLLKYNEYTKHNYYKFMNDVIIFCSKLDEIQRMILIIFSQIIPRLILVTILMLDIFLFQRIELFYYIILLGVIPFIHRYIKHSLKDVKDEYIKQLEELYDEVTMFDLAYADPDVNWEPNENNKYHDKEISLREYIEFKINTSVYENTFTKYESVVLAKESIYISYRTKNNIPEDQSLTDTDHDVIKKEYDEKMPKILKIGIFLELYSIDNNAKIIVRCKIVIFSLYLISWLYVLIKSYYVNPNDFQITVKLLIETLLNNKDPFSETCL